MWKNCLVVLFLFCETGLGVEVLIRDEKPTEVLIGPDVKTAPAQLPVGECRIILVRVEHGNNPGLPPFYEKLVCIKEKL